MIINGELRRGGSPFNDRVFKRGEVPGMKGEYKRGKAPLFKTLPPLPDGIGERGIQGVR